MLTRTLGFIVVSAAMLGGAVTAPAAVTLDLTPVDNSALLTGYATYDLNVTTDTDWTVGVALLELSAGHLYQHPQGTDVGKPGPLLASMYPALAFDTHVIGSLAGGAGDLGGSGFAFNDSQLDVTWFNIESTDIGLTTVGRLTLTDDTAGQMSLLLASAGEVAEYDVTFSSGVSPVLMQVIQEVEEIGDDPEPNDKILPLPHDAWGSMYGAHLNPYVDDAIWLPDLGYRGMYRAPIDRSAAYGYNKLELLTPEFRSPRLRDTSTRVVNLWGPGMIKSPTDNGPSLLPEPGALVLVGVGLGAAVLRRR